MFHRSICVLTQPTARSRECGIALLPLLFLAFAACAGADVKVDLSAGFDNNYRPGAWTPLTVRVANAPSTTPAQLQVQVRTRMSGTATYTQTVNLHGGSSVDQYTAYYLHPDSAESPEITVQLIVNGRIAADKKLEGSIPLLDGQPAVLGLTQDQSGLNFLQQVDLGVTHRSGREPGAGFGGMSPQSNNPFQNPGGIARPRNPTRVLYPRASTLPGSAFGYASVDAVVLGISPQDVDSHERWIADKHLPFPLLADVDKRVIEAYDIAAPLIGVRRSVFLIDTAGIVRWRLTGTVRAIFKKPEELAREIAAMS